MLSTAPERELTTAAAARQWILDSRLGACWKCMTFTVCMLLISAGGFVTTMRWQDLEGTDSVALARFVVGAALVSTCAFALLAIAHFVMLVLRKSIWRD